MRLVSSIMIAAAYFSKTLIILIELHLFFSPFIMHLIYDPEGSYDLYKDKSDLDVRHF